MKKWTAVSFNVTREEKEQLEKFKDDYKISYNKKDDYTLNKLLRYCIFTCVKTFYKGNFKFEKEIKILELEDYLKNLQKQVEDTKKEIYDLENGVEDEEFFA